jgi:hypothetical protein
MKFFEKSNFCKSLRNWKLREKNEKTNSSRKFQFFLLKWTFRLIGSANYSLLQRYLMFNLQKFLIFFSKNKAKQQNFSTNLLKFRISLVELMWFSDAKLNIIKFLNLNSLLRKHVQRFHRNLFLFTIFSLFSKFYLTFELAISFSRIFFFSQEVDTSVSNFNQDDTCNYVFVEERKFKK